MSFLSTTWGLTQWLLPVYDLRIAEKFVGFILTMYPCLCFSSILSCLQCGWALTMHAYNCCLIAQWLPSNHIVATTYDIHSLCVGLPCILIEARLLILLLLYYRAVATGTTAAGTAMAVPLFGKVWAPSTSSSVLTSYVVCIVFIDIAITKHCSAITCWPIIRDDCIVAKHLGLLRVMKFYFLCMWCKR